MTNRQKIVKPYYKYKQKAFTDLVKAVEVVATRVWGNGKPLNFSPSDFVFEISYTLGSFKKISIYRGGGSYDYGAYWLNESEVEQVIRVLQKWKSSK